MEIKSKYITEEEFKQYTGIDLSLELKDDDNPSNKVQSFLCRVEIRIATFIDSNFHRNVELEYPKFSDYQKYHYKLALLEQCLYVFKNGDISVDSGYDSEKGVMISSGEKKKIVFCLTGTGYFDLKAYSAFNNNTMQDYIPTDEELEKGFATLPKIN